MNNKPMNKWSDILLKILPLTIALEKTENRKAEKPRSVRRDVHVS